MAISQKMQNIYLEIVSVKIIYDILCSCQGILNSLRPVSEAILIFLKMKFVAKFDKY